MFKFMQRDWNIVKYFKVFAAVSLSIILLGVIVLCFTGFNLGIEFAGGVEMTVDFEENDVTDAQYSAVESAVRSHMRSVGLDVAQGGKITDDGKIDGIQYNYRFQINGQDVDEAPVNAIYSMLENGGIAISDSDREILTEYLGDNFDFDGFESIAEIASDVTDGAVTATPSVYMVGQSVSTRLFQTSLIALAVALVLILIYIVIRFRSLGAENNFVSGLKSGLAAIIALIHDVLIMMSFVIIAGWLFNLQITSTFVAAVVTIVAYSINNTIVVFDRLRDNRKRYVESKTPDEIVNTSVRDVFTRSVFTSLTTIFAVLVLTILGGAALREFTLPILVGLLAGTYSSLFIAPCLWKLFNGKAKKKAEVKN